MAIDLSGDHLSLYQLTIEPGTPFFRNRIKAACEDLGAALFEITLEMTSAAGLPAYEISNHARPGFESKHNLTYWEGGDYIGIGPGAHGRISTPEGCFASYQIHNPARWLSRVEKFGHGTGKIRPLLARERAEEIFMTGLRLADGLDTAAIASKTGLDVSELVNNSILESLIDEGLIEKKGLHLAATRDGWMVLNALIQALLTETTDNVN